MKSSFDCLKCSWLLVTMKNEMYFSSVTFTRILHLLSALNKGSPQLKSLSGKMRGAMSVQRYSARPNQLEHIFTHTAGILLFMAWVVVSGWYQLVRVIMMYREAKQR